MYGFNAGGGEARRKEEGGRSQEEGARRCLRKRIVEHGLLVALKDLIQEVIRRTNLGHFTSARNDDFTCAEDAHGDTLTLAFALSRTLPFTDLLTGADTRTTIGGIVEVFGIDTLIDGLLQHAEEIVFINQQFMESVLINEPIDGVVRIDELDRESVNMDRKFKRRLRERLNDSVEPIEGRLSEGLRGDTCHLDTAVRKQFDVHLLPGITLLLLIMILALALVLNSMVIRHSATNHNGGLIKERLVGDLTMCEDILVGPSLNTWTVFNLEHTFVGIPERNHVGPKRVKDRTQIHRGAPVSRNDHRGDAERCLLEFHGAFDVALKLLRLNMLFQFYL